MGRALGSGGTALCVGIVHGLDRHDAAAPPNASAAPAIAKPVTKKPVKKPAAKKAEGSGKLGKVVALLKRPKGATLVELVKATGWQQHSVRGFLAGVVRKKLDLNLVSALTDKGRLYRIKDGNAAPSSASRAKQAA